MKNLKKMMAIVAASAIMLASVPALAAQTEISFTGGNGAVTAVFDDATNKVTATVNTSKAVVDTEMTFLILNKNVTNEKIASGIEAADVLYIDQKTLKTTDNTFEGPINLSRVYGIENDATALPAGTYPIRLGLSYQDNEGNQDFALACGELEVSAGGAVEFLWGDINGDAYVDTLDALEIVYTGMGKVRNVTVKDTSNTVLGNTTVGLSLGDQLLWGDVNGDAYVDTLDALEIVYTGMGKVRNVTVKDISGKSLGNTVVGTAIEIPYTK